jgi:hypothetical protein
MSKKRLDEIYKIWENSKEEERFLIGRLYWTTPIFRPTVEGLSAYKAYKNLPREERVEYAKFSSNLYDLFFLLSPEQEDFVERNLPPYYYLSRMIWEERKISEDEIRVLLEKTPKNPLKSMKIRKEKEKIAEKYGLIPEEYKSILKIQREDDWKAFRKIMILFYGVTALQLYLYTSNPTVPLFYLLTFPLPYNFLKYLSFKISDRRVSNFIDKLSIFYIAARSPQSLAISLAEYGFGAPLIAKIIEKYWFSDYFPDFLRKTIYSIQTFISGLKTREFDEKEMRELLYNIKIDSSNIPQSSIDRFKEEIDNELIELEDPREVLLHPWSVSWLRRRVVAVPEGKNIRIVDRQFIRKLAEKEGTFEKEMEYKVIRNPTKYLGFDLWRGSLVFTRDIIGILPCQIENALAYKEGYIAVLGKKSDEMMERKLSTLIEG